MTETAHREKLHVRIGTLDFGSRTGLQTAINLANEALAIGEVTAVERICRRILSIDLEHEEALSLLVCVLSRQGRHAEALPVVGEILGHFRDLNRRNSIAYGLFLLEQRGFEPRGILDIGAYGGEFTMLARQCFPNAPVVLVEPQPRMQCLLEETARNLGSNVVVRRALLGELDGSECTFYELDTPFGSTGSSMYPEASEHPRRAVPMRTQTVDSLLAEFRGQQFDLVKIDVQGAELDVLRGAKATLPGVEVMFLELSLHECNHGAPRMAEVVACLDGLGFAIFELLQMPRGGDGLQLQTDAIFVRKTSPLWHRPDIDRRK